MGLFKKINFSFEEANAFAALRHTDFVGATRSSKRRIPLPATSSYPATYP